MTSTEIKKAMQQEKPVIYNGIEYACIREYIYDWKGKLSVSLLDKNRNTLVRAPVDKVALAERSKDGV